MKILILALAIGGLALLALVNKPIYYKAAEKIEIESKELKILFVGDMMFDRGIRQALAKYGEEKLFSCLTPLFESADLVVGNLEGSITSHDSVSVGSVVGSPNNFRFTFPTSSAALLTRLGVSIVNLGNNHILDFGREGLASTREYLELSGINHFGGVASDSPIYKMSRNGLDFSFISYNQFGGENASEVARIIKEEKSAGRIVVVYTHWGEEYVEPTARVEREAALFAENGADLIIGSHPHVVQRSEKVGETLIYYSLGNFIFDQYFSEEVQRGLSVLVTFSQEGITAEEEVVAMVRGGSTCPVE